MISICCEVVKQNTVLFLSEIMPMSTSSYVSDFASSSLECTIWANVTVYGLVQIRSFRQVTNASVVSHEYNVY